MIRSQKIHSTSKNKSKEKNKKYHHLGLDKGLKEIKLHCPVVDTLNNKKFSTA